MTTTTLVLDWQFHLLGLLRVRQMLVRSLLVQPTAIKTKYLRLSPNPKVYAEQTQMSDLPFQSIYK